jgi:endoglycosylceramidase
VSERARPAVAGAVLAIGAITLALAATLAAAAPRDPLGNEGRWITDAAGRVVVLHGMNMVTGPPGGTPERVGFGRDDARFLRRNGFNTVRLGLYYSAVEPSPGRYNDHYLDSLARTARLLAKHGIYVLLDFHQDMYNRTFQGRGFPDWAVQDDGLPHEPKVGFPGNYYFMPALQHAYDNFWENSPGPGGVGLQDRYAAAWRHVAKRSRKLNRLVGYDIMNEPWAGTQMQCTEPAGCPEFDRGPHHAFNTRVFSAIREVDRNHLVWHEPLLPYGFGVPSFTPDTGEERAGFTFHAYCAHGVPQFELIEPELAPIPCSEINARIFAQAEAASRRTGDALLLGEFGANVRTPDSIVEAVTLADQFMVGWQHWHYSNDNPADPTPDFDEIVVGDARKPPRGANVDHERLALLARPYPQAVAGTPVRWEFDPSTHRFVLEYKTRPVSRGDPQPEAAKTEVVVPRLQYPDGYRANVAGGRIASAGNARLLKIAARHEARRVTVRVDRPGGP